MYNYVLKPKNSLIAVIYNFLEHISNFWLKISFLVKNMIFAWNIKMGVKSSLLYVKLCAESKNSSLIAVIYTILAILAISG